MAFNATFASQGEMLVSFNGRSPMDADFSSGTRLETALFPESENIRARFQPQDPLEVDFSSGSGRVPLPPGGLPGDLLAKRTAADGDTEWITPANSAEQDNTRPITAAAVYTEIGNINALLASI